MSDLFSPKRYALVYVIAVLALAVFEVGLEVLARYSLPMGIRSILPPIMAAMYEGQKRAQAGLEPLDGSAAWKAARGMTYVVLAVSIMLLLISLLIPGWGSLLWVLPPMFLIGMLAFELLMAFLVNRFFVGIGYRNQRMAMDRRSR